MAQRLQTNEIDRQLPVGEEVFLDHVGHFIADPDTASAAFARAGFFPTPRSVQQNPGSHDAPSLTGTGNVTSMFLRGYVEALYKTADTPLGRELDLARERYAGIHLVAFAVSDAATAHRRLQSVGFRMRPLVHMERSVQTETGTDTAKFVVARTEPGQMVEGRVQVLTHESERAVWQPRWLSHPNGATGLIDLAIVTADIDEAAARFSRFLGRPSITNASGRFIKLDRGGVKLMTSQAFSRMAVGFDIPSLPYIGLYAISVRSIPALRECLIRGGIEFVNYDKSVLARFPGELGVGGWLFVEKPDDIPWRAAQ